MNWIKLNVRVLNWNGQNLKDWNQLWSNLEGVTYNLTKINNKKLVFISYIFDEGKISKYLKRAHFKDL